MDRGGQAMIRPELMLNHLPFAELLEDVMLLLHHDRIELERQATYFHQIQSSGEKSDAYMDKFEARLHHAQNRLEFFNQLLCRCQTYYFQCIAMALEKAEKEAIKKGTPNQYGLFLFFNEGYLPEILIL